MQPQSQRTKVQTGPLEAVVMASNWWLAEVTSYGYAKNLIDGPHDERAGAEEALTLHKRLGFADTRKRYAVVQLIQFPASGDHPPVNEDAIATLNALGLRP